MFFEIKQIRKELFSAEFDVIQNNQCAGSMHLQGKLGSMEGQWKGVAFGDEFCMERNRDIRNKKIFRPYNFIFSGERSGCVYQTEQKDGLFSKIEFHQIALEGVQYNLYSISLGKEGRKYPVYIGDEQIALIEKDCIVYDELHQYRINAVDEEAARIALLFVCYMYVNAAYKPGVKVTKSVTKTMSITTNKKLIQKYDPNFVQRMHTRDYSN